MLITEPIMKMIGREPVVATEFMMARERREMLLVICKVTSVLVEGMGAVRGTRSMRDALRPERLSLRAHSMSCS